MKPPAPFSQPGAKRRVVNMPTDRIRALLDAVAEWEAWYEQVAEVLARVAPDLFADTVLIPPRPNPEAVVHERIYQKLRGRDIERARTNQRNYRARLEMGLHAYKRVAATQLLDDEAQRAVDEALSGSIDNQSIGIVPTPPATQPVVTADPATTVTVIDEIIQPKPGLTQPGIKEDS